MKIYVSNDGKLFLKNWSRYKMSGQPLDETLRNKIDEKMPEMYAKTVLKSMPDTEIMTSNTVINYVKQNSPLDDERR